MREREAWKRKKFDKIICLHLASFWWNNLVVIGSDLAWWHLVQALLDDTQTLTHLFHAHQITIVSVTVHTDRHIKFNLIISVVWLSLSQIPFDAGASKHDTAEAEIQSIFGRDGTDTDRTLTPQTIGSEKIFDFIETLAELIDELIDIVHETDG